MKFVSPAWLWSLMILPLIYLWIVLSEREKKRRFSQFVQPELWSKIVPQWSPYHRIYKARFLLVGFASLLVALARPQFGTHEEVVELTGLDVMLVLDVSHSMNVEDVVPSRLKAAKHLTRSLVQQLEGDRVGVVAFAGSSYVACPLTADLSYLMDTVQILSPRAIQRQGTNIAEGIEAALKAIERGGQDTQRKNDTALPSHVIILISDGEDHSGDAIAAAGLAKTSGVKLYVLGVGTAKGGPIPLFDDKGNLQTYKKDKKGQPIVSAFSEASLARVADAAGGKYWSVTPGEHEVEELLQDLKGLTRADYGERKFLVYEERFQLPLALAILCFLLEMSIMAHRALAVVLLLFYGILSVTRTAYASENGSGSGVGEAPPSQSQNVSRGPDPGAPLGSYLENQKGLEAFKEGRIEEAQKSFGAAQARDPTRPELQFNQGIVQFQQGDIDRAIEAFRSSARATQNGPNQDLYGKSLYNLGNAFAKKGNAKEAIQSYLGAIGSAQTMKNQHLEDESRKNLELLLKQIKKQQDKQKQDKNDAQENQSKSNEQNDQQKDEQKKNQSQQGQEKADPSKSESQSPKPEQKPNQPSDSSKPSQEDKSDSSKPKTEASQKNQSSQDSTSGEEETKEDQQNVGEQKSSTRKKPGKQSFQSKKMAPEDADRVMSELTNRDRELQEKLQAQNEATQNSSQNNAKDW